MVNEAGKQLIGRTIDQMNQQLEQLDSDQLAAEQGVARIRDNIARVVKQRDELLENLEADEPEA